MINVQLTKEELSALIQLIDLSVKHAGMQVAEAAVVLTKKLQEALNPIAPVVTDANK